MISFLIKQRGTRVEIILLLIFLSIFFFAISLSATHAQAATTATAPTTGININDLTAANGWTCNSTIIGGQAGQTCTDAAGDTATCPITGGGGGFGIACQETNASGAIIGSGAIVGSPLTSTTIIGNTSSTQLTPLGQGLQCLINGPFQCILTAVAYTLFQLAASVLGFVGLIFNWVVVVTVFEFGAYFANSPNMLAAWGILRDIGNIVLLFGFIFMGICTILDIGPLDNFTAGKALPRLLIFAVLLNFSLFASEAVVDVANTLSAAFYQVAGSGDTACNGTILTGISGSCATNGISGTILTSSGLSTIWTYSTNTTANSTPFGSPTDPKTALIMVLMAVFVAIAAIVLLAGAIMLIVRALVLAFLLIVSPLGFAGMAIPPLQKTANAWWHKLINEAFFAPIFFLLVYAGLKVSAVVTPAGGAGFATAVINPSSSTIGIIFGFLIVMGFFVAALVVSKSMSASGASIAINTSGRLVGAATIGTTAFVARRTIGAGSGGIAKGLRSIPFVGQSELGRGVVSFFDKGARASYDARSTKAIQGLTKNKTLPINLGEPSKAAKGGIRGIEKKATDKRTEYAKGFKVKDVALDKGLKKEKTDRSKAWEDRKDELETTIREAPAKETSTRAQLATLTAQLATAQQEQANAYRSGDIAAQGTARIKINTLNTQIGDLNTSITEGTQNLAKAISDLKTEEDKYNSDIAAINKRMRENNPALQYAENLENDVFAYLIPLSVGPRANEEAAKTIKGNANKNDIDKALDTFREELNKKNGEGDGHDAGGSAAPSPATPPPSGGAPTAGGAGGGTH